MIINPLLFVKGLLRNVEEVVQNHPEKYGLAVVNHLFIGMFHHQVLSI